VKKISSLFARDPSNPRILTDDFHPDAAWVVAGEGIATRKWDGTAVLVRGGKLFARYDIKRGKVAPAGFEPAQDPDPNTGHHPGWVPAERPEDKWIREAASAARHRIRQKDPYWPYTDASVGVLDDGTYEACGPKINGNPEGLDDHRLIRHGRFVLAKVPRDKAGLVEFFRAHNIEGVVWWRQEGDDACDKVKITAEALGVERSA
jgi:hypothetical protein